ncbi:MAG: TonB-dependent receptor [Mariniphaga sp.]
MIMLNYGFKKLFILTFYGILVLTQPAFSQEVFHVRGFVLHANTGDPVGGANISVLGTARGSVSDHDGFFKLQLPPGEFKISVTSVGFSDEEIIVLVPDRTKEMLNIKLMPRQHEIEGVDIYGRFDLPGRDTSINRIPVSILPAMTTITAADIEKQGAVTLVDAMKYVTGGWTETRGRKTKQFFSLRGQKYPYPDYSIDGVWQREFEETGYFFSALDIESVEIVRSSSALVKGLSGLTGVVDVKTKKPERETVSLLTRYGEQNNYFANLQYGNKINDLSFQTSASFFGTDGPVGKNGKERLRNFHGTFNWLASEHIRIAAGATYISGLRQLMTIDDEIGAPNIKSRKEEYDPVNTLLTYVKISFQGRKGAQTDVQTNYSYRDVDYYTFNISQESTTSHEENDWEYGVNVLHSQPVSKTNTLRLGALYNHWVAPEGKRYYVGRSCDVHTFSGVVASEQKAGKFLFDAGFRMIGGHIVEWGGFGIEGSASGFGNVAPIEDQAAPFEWQSVLGATYLFSEVSSLHYNFSGGTIAPRKGSLTDAGARPESESRFNHELGFRYHLAGKAEFTANSFLTNRNDAIDYSGETVVTNNDLVMELYENLDKRSYGMEASAKISIPGVYSDVFVNGLVMKGEKESDGRMQEDSQLPKVMINAGFLFDHSDFDASLFVHHTGPYTNNRFVNPAWVQEHGNFPLGDFTTADLTAGYTLKGRVATRFFIEVKNVLDKKFMTVAGYPDPGRLIMAGLRINYHSN